MSGARPALVLLSLALGLALPAWAKAADCSKALAAQSAAVASARADLLALPVGDGMVTDVSPAEQAVIGRMKDALAGLADAEMTCAPADASAAQINKDLSRLGHAFVLQPGQENTPLGKDQGKYGFELGFDVARWPGRSPVIGVVASFDIECGSDAMLLLYAPAPGGGWRETLRWQSAPYSEIKGALGGLDYAVSPPDAAGRRFVVEKDIMPWCTSTWSMVRYAALRPGPRPDQPHRLLVGQDTIWFGGDDDGSLKVDAGAFEVRFHAASIDTDVHNRVFIRRFSVVGDAVRRIPPVAVSPRDFVDEWIVSPWADAAQWSARQVKAADHALHDRLKKEEFFTFASARTCSDRPDHVDVAITSDDPPARYDFDVVGRTDFLMTRVSTGADALCRGADRLASMATK